jgi:thymidylate kinase
MQIIVFDSIDFSGKSTQLDLLRDQYPKSILLREPGGTVAGSEIRKIFLDDEIGKELDDVTRTLLLFAARKRLVVEEILPLIRVFEDGTKVILMDRFFPSTFAYQWSSIKKREERELIETLTRIIIPQEILDKVVVFQLSIPYGMYRSRLLSRKETNHMDFWSEGEFYRIQNAFHVPVTLGFLQDSQFCVIDGTQTPEAIFEQVKDAIFNPSKFVGLTKTKHLLHWT